jgi:hypothetical protein
MTARSPAGFFRAAKPREGVNRNPRRTTMDKTTTARSDYQERARRFVEGNVLVCQSSLIDHLLGRGDVPGFTVDDIENLYDASADAITEYLSGALDTDEWRAQPPEARERLAQDHGFEPEPHEIYEWWVVTPYLAKRLQELGQPLLTNDFGTWWGRTCTGQAVYADHVIGRIIGAPADA